MNLGWESGNDNKLCTLLLPSEPDTSPSPVTTVKSHEKNATIIFLWLPHLMVKCYQNVNFEEIDTETSKGKNDGCWLLPGIFKD